MKLSLNPLNSFSRVAVYLERSPRDYLLHGVVAVPVGAPDGLERGSEALGAQHARGGDRVLAVAAQQNETPVVVVVERLREQLAAAQLASRPHVSFGGICL